MNSRTIDVVTDWETVSAPDGYEGLHELADGEFSGAVSAGMTWAFFLNGRVVGVFEGDIGDFERAELTAYRAADPSLPLLFSMQERGGETQASYYTNETSLSEADQTLSNGGFTGYIELSENVLSGDYYVVYHGGKSMSAAFVGNSGRLITGEEAFETAADEVGIYEVIDTDVELVDIPEPPSAAGDEAEDEAPTEDAAGGDETGAPDDGSDGADEEEAEANVPDGDGRDDEVAATEAGESGTETDSGTTSAAETTDDQSVTSAAETTGDQSVTSAEPTDDESTVSGDPESAPDAPEEPSTTSEEEPGGEAAEADVAAEPTAGGRTFEGPEPEVPTETASEATATTGRREAAGDSETAPSGEDSGVFSDEERWREAKTIPSLDPSASGGNGTTGGTAADESDRRSARERVAQMQRDRSARKEARERTASGSTPSPTKATERRPSPAAGEGVQRLKKRLSRARDRGESVEAERNELAEERAELQRERAEREQRIEKLEGECEEYRERIDELESERERLEAEVQRFQSERDAAASEGGPARETSMSPERALSGTNLFVRYDRKGEATLEHAHDGEATREDVSDNLRLEHHTTFETDGLVVEDRPYVEFLHDSTEYTFANWLVTDLLYEIGQTGNRSGLAGVFDAIPDVDRIELYGTVGVEGDDGVEQRDFDVIFRDKMGDPLFVADINASRNATTEGMVDSLVTNTGTIANEDDSLAAGFYVTESFYEPGALETVAEETGGGLLSRSSKLSYVKLSRKRGYHLCLAEARNGEFHLNVPDL